MMYQHECEILPVNPGPEGIISLCQLLDRKSTEGKECLSIMPMQLAEPMLRNGVLAASRPQAAFAVIFRFPKQVQNGEVVLDRGQDARRD